MPVMFKKDEPSPQRRDRKISKNDGLLHNQPKIESRFSAQDAVAVKIEASGDQLEIKPLNTSVEFLSEAEPSNKALGSILEVVEGGIGPASSSSCSVSNSNKDEKDVIGPNAKFTDNLK